MGNDLPEYTSPVLSREDLVAYLAERNHAGWPVFQNELSASVTYTVVLGDFGTSAKRRSASRT